MSRHGVAMRVVENELTSHPERFEVIAIGRRTKQHRGSIELAKALRPGNGRFVMALIDQDQVETREQNEHIPSGLSLCRSFWPRVSSSPADHVQGLIGAG